MNPETIAHESVARIGVLLVNLGTPERPTPAAVRRYLAEFLSDPRVVELPRALWLPILYAFILPTRPRRVARAYAAVWQDDGSPLLSISRRITEALAARLRASLGDRVVTALAMRYGNPSIASALADFERDNVRRLLVLPMYPQYSASTTASVMDGVFAVLKRQRWMPELQSIHGYHDDARYIAALADSVRRHWSAHGRGDRLMLSFHGIPKRYVEAGDPYFCHCQKTARLLAEALELAPEALHVTFQSRFGRQPWLSPYTDETLKAWGGAGVGTVDVLCPGFAADCLETLEEIAIRDAGAFVAAGARALRYIPALNDRALHLDALQALIESRLAPWSAQCAAPPAAGQAGRIAALKASWQQPRSTR